MEKDYSRILKVTEHSRLLKGSRRNLINQRNWLVDHDMLPKDVWLKNLETSGSYSCLEIIPFDPKTGIVYLKERHDPTATGGEKEWEGKLHIPGLSNLPRIRGDQAPSILLKKEILKDQKDTDKYSELSEFVTEVKYPEPERNTVAVTLELKVPVDPNDLQSDFRPVTKGDLNRVIEQHQPMLEAYWKGSVPITMDTRNK